MDEAKLNYTILDAFSYDILEKEDFNMQADYGDVITRFEDSDVEEDGTLITLAMSLLALYQGGNSYLNSMKTKAASSWELTNAQVRGVLNCMIGDVRFTRPMLLRLNDCNDNVTKAEILKAAIKRGKSKDRFTEVTTKFPEFEGMIEVEYSPKEMSPYADTGGKQLVPTRWKIGMYRTAPGYATLHLINSDKSYIQDGVSYLWSSCGQLPTTMPDPFGVWDICKLPDPKDDSIHICGKCRIGKFAGEYGKPYVS